MPKTDTGTKRKKRLSVTIGEFGDAARWLRKQGMFFADGDWHYADGRKIGQDGLPAIVAFYGNEILRRKP